MILRFAVLFLFCFAIYIHKACAQNGIIKQHKRILQIYRAQTFWELITLSSVAPILFICTTTVFPVSLGWKYIIWKLVYFLDGIISFGNLCSCELCK